MKSEKDLAAQISRLPQSPGVYIFRDKNGQTLYVGKSVRLQERVKSYFKTSQILGPRTRRMVQSIDKVHHIPTASELEALLLEADLIKRLKPKYNIQWRDDKGYKYIKIENARSGTQGLKEGREIKQWPYVTTSRKADDPHSLYFGPFPEGRTVTQVLKTLRKIFPWCHYKDKAALKRSGRPCLYYHLKQCPGICAGKISLREYWKIIHELIAFLSSNKEKLIWQYRQAMQQAAASRNFERAAYFRDKLHQLEYITQQFHQSSEYLQNPNLVEDIREQEIKALLRVLENNLPSFLISRIQQSISSIASFRIEAYDISNLGPEHTSASRVVFVGGEPDKSAYRRYRINLKKTPNDIAALREALQRRFRNYPGNSQETSEGTPKTTQPFNHLPHLILIDGGKGQVRVGLEVLAAKNLHLSTAVVGLAKREEDLILPIYKDQAPFWATGFKTIRLKRNSPALKLLQRTRDEAHRFAKKYHRYLRRKEIWR